MAGTIDVLDPANPKHVLIVASNPAVSEQTGWPVGFWWSELTHPYWEFVEHGYEVTVASPDGGTLQADSWSDPRNESGYAADDLLSLGFVSSPTHRALIEDTPKLADLELDRFDAVLAIGGQGPMYTFRGNADVTGVIAACFEAGKPTAAICHGTCVLLDARTSDGDLVVAGRTWTGFANSEEDYADAAVGTRIQPFRIEDEARGIDGTNFVVHGPFKAHAVRDGNLITGQQQYSGGAAARLIIEALGV